MTQGILEIIADWIFVNPQNCKKRGIEHAWVRIPGRGAYRCIRPGCGRRSDMHTARWVP